ncbi:hypothetical protein JKP31_20200 [Vibrio vulnificus]|uniref:hypothetical protein n=1 Tax=Vibrio vulnificus TaxID=672 RepID=UPI001CDBE64E|nr:hypothetical protein [Vibrio vulnificus]MCA3903604.1 hypothetical protein [Vibrio vulnificus]
MKETILTFLWFSRPIMKKRENSEMSLTANALSYQFKKISVRVSDGEDALYQDDDEDEDFED